MNRVVRGGLALCTGFGLTLVAIKVADRDLTPTLPAGAKLGQLDMNGYCQRAYGPRSSAVHLSSGAYGWRCWTTNNGLVTRLEIRVDTACELTYDAPAYAESFDLDFPYSWECYRGPRQPD